MALKGDRTVLHDQIDFFMNEVAERGGVASMSTLGSGVALDQASQLCTYAANPSGRMPIGVLLNDMVNLDLTRQKLNPYKDEVQIGGKVTLAPQGEFVTNLIQQGVTIAAGERVFLHASGYLTNNNHLDHSNNRVGTWMSRKDQNGYAKFSINLPRNN